MVDILYLMVLYLLLYDEGSKEGSVKEKWKMC